MHKIMLISVDCGEISFVWLEPGVQTWFLYGGFFIFGTSPGNFSPARGILNLFLFRQRTINWERCETRNLHFSWTPTQLLSVSSYKLISGLRFLYSLWFKSSKYQWLTTYCRQTSSNVTLWNKLRCSTKTIHSATNVWYIIMISVTLVCDF